MRIVAGRMADARGVRERVEVTVRGWRIRALNPGTRRHVPCRQMSMHATRCSSPGFIDIHVHGGAGRYVMEATASALAAVAQHLARYGVTGFLSTTVTGPWSCRRRRWPWPHGLWSVIAHGRRMAALRCLAATWKGRISTR